MESRFARRRSLRCPFYFTNYLAGSFIYLAQAADWYVSCLYNDTSTSRMTGTKSY